MQPAKLHVLNVDDNDDTCLVLSALLGQAGDGVRPLSGYEKTPERERIISTLERALDELRLAADLISLAGEREAAHRTLNAAQGVSLVMSLLAGGWGAGDEERAARV
jgi:hypothetical protein